MAILTLLLVDDHLAFLNATIRQLSRFDWIRVVGTAEDGIQAVEQSERLKPHAVLMDLAMPEMGGLQATRFIKAQDNPPFVIITSHFDDVAHREHAAQAGADAFVSKLTYITDAIPLLERLRDRTDIETTLFPATSA